MRFDEVQEAVCGYARREGRHICSIRGFEGCDGRDWGSVQAVILEYLLERLAVPHDAACGDGCRCPVHLSLLEEVEVIESHLSRYRNQPLMGHDDRGADERKWRETELMLDRFYDRVAAAKSGVVPPGTP
jgi:hypothetical protein